MSDHNEEDATLVKQEIQPEKTGNEAEKQENDAEGEATIIKREI
jgi:hypothetical protein